LQQAANGFLYATRKKASNLLINLVSNSERFKITERSLHYDELHNEYLLKLYGMPSGKKLFDMFIKRFSKRILINILYFYLKEFLDKSID